MFNGLTRVLRALDAPGPVVGVFIRDDDAGWGHATLMALLDVTMHAGVPIDLAAIPTALDNRLIADLTHRIDGEPVLVGIHQHGHSHANHEAEGRRCEFGPARSVAEQRADVWQGQQILRAAFKHRLDAIFTPPWNRCTESTAALLHELGFAALSRDRRATPVTCMHDIAVDVDWSRAWREDGEERTADAFVAAINARAADGQPLGLMLHHDAMAHDERVALSHWLGALRSHPRLHWQPMRQTLRANPLNPIGRSYS